MNDAEVLAKAEQLIAKPKNWTQGTFHRQDDGTDSYCLLGALNRALVGDADPRNHVAAEREIRNQLNRIRGMIREVVLEQFPNRSIGPMSFNDHPATTHDEVMGVLQKARAKAEEMGQ